MKRLATLERWARRLAEREDLLPTFRLTVGQTELHPAVAKAGKERDRRIVLALAEAYSTGYHDALKEAIRNVERPAGKSSRMRRPKITSSGWPVNPGPRRVK